MPDDRPSNPLLALLRDGQRIGWVRSGQVDRPVKGFLARDVQLEHGDRRDPGLRLFVSSTRAAHQPYIRLATSATRVSEAFGKVLAIEGVADDVVMVDDDGGLVLRIARGELHPPREPTIGDWAADGVVRLTVWCDRCQRRAEHDVQHLIAVGGAELESARSPAI